jgi:hypothetical protein
MVEAGMVLSLSSALKRIQFDAPKAEEVCSALVRPLDLLTRRAVVSHAMDISNKALASAKPKEEKAAKGAAQAQVSSDASGSNIETAAPQAAGDSMQEDNPENVDTGGMHVEPPAPPGGNWGLTGSLSAPGSPQDNVQVSDSDEDNSDEDDSDSDEDNGDDVVCSDSDGEADDIDEALHRRHSEMRRFQNQHNLAGEEEGDFDDEEDDDDQDMSAEEEDDYDEDEGDFGKSHISVVGRGRGGGGARGRER